MKKLILTLLFGVLLSGVSKAQYIEVDSTGIPRACTNYEYHNKQKENKKIVQGLIFLGSCVTIMAIEHAVWPSEQNNVEHLATQMAYAGVAVVGAVVTVNLYRWNVKLQNKVGL